MSRIPGLLASIEECARQHGLLPDDCRRLRLGVEEALVNICHYAYDSTPPGDVSLEVFCCDTGVRVVIEDEGREFNPLKVPPPELAGDLRQRRVGGLGIHLMRLVSTGSRYQRIGNRNRLELSFPWETLAAGSRPDGCCRSPAAPPPAS